MPIDNTIFKVAVNKNADCVDGSEVHPMLSMSDVRTLFGRNDIIVLNEQAVQIPIEPIKTIWLDNGMLVPFVESYYSPDSSGVRTLKLKNVTLEELYEVINHPEKYPKSFFRLYDLGDNIYELIIIKDRELHFGEKHSRTFPIYGSLQNRKEVFKRGMNINDEENNINELFRMIDSDPNFELLRKIEIVIVGAGTVAMAILDGLSRLGVCHFTFYELEDEKISLANSQRLSGASELDVGKPKWRHAIDIAVANNPEVSIKYKGRLRDRKQLENDFSDIGGEAERFSLAFLALDNEGLRAQTHCAFEKLNIDTVALADVGLGSLMKYFSYSEGEDGGTGGKLINARTDTERRIAGIGLSNILFKLDTNLVEVALSTQAYGYLPQTHAAALLTEALAVYVVLQKIITGKVGKSIYLDPYFQQMSILDKVRATFKKIRMLVNAMKKSHNEQ